uniref:Uncharacterized protein n=1 Tax=Rhizophora mucronata TaxID=61149 RepID=A0A2P2NZ13_RHIMU
MLKHHLQRAQRKMRQLTNQHRSDQVFSVQV